MTALLDSSWFYWAIGVAVGLPVGLILLTEWQHVLVRRQSILARPVSLLRNYLASAGCVAVVAGQGHRGVGRGDVGARGGHRVRLRRAGDAAVRAERDGLPGRARGQLAQTDADHLHRRGPLRADRARPGGDLLLYLGRQRRRSVHRAGNQHRCSGPGVAELRRADHLRPAVAVRAAVPARRLARHPDGARAGWSR